MSYDDPAMYLFEPGPILATENTVGGVPAAHVALNDNDNIGHLANHSTSQ
jgi:hypothetical protein